MPATADPAHDLTEAGIVVFRRFALEHPGLFRIGVQHAEIAPEIARGFYETARHALTGLQERVRRLGDTGALGGRTIYEATIEFHALCEGLAALELRGMLPEGREERLWRSALSALVDGFANG